ncbi:uncharacterized protein LOC144135164 [Amblyomma americanum]
MKKASPVHKPSAPSRPSLRSTSAPSARPSAPPRQMAPQMPVSAGAPVAAVTAAPSLRKMAPAVRMAPVPPVEPPALPQPLAAPVEAVNQETTFGTSFFGLDASKMFSHTRIEAGHVRRVVIAIAMVLSLAAVLTALLVVIVVQDDATTTTHDPFFINHEPEQTHTVPTFTSPTEPKTGDVTYRSER